MKNQIIDTYKKDIDSTTHNLMIVTGLANNEIYGSKEIKESFLKAQERGVFLQIMAGPIINSDMLENVILELIGMNNIGIYRRKGRPLVHYRVMDGKRVSQEDIHHPLAELSKRKQTLLDKDEQRFWAERYRDTFYYEIENGIAKKVDSEKDFLILPSTQIKGLYDCVESRGRSFNFLNKEELSDFLRQEPSKITTC